MDFKDLLCDINGCISAPVPDFYQKYFNEAGISEGTALSKVPDILDTFDGSNDFAEWFVNLATANRDGACGSWSVSAKGEEHSERGLMEECTQLSFNLSDTEHKIAKPGTATQVVGLVCPGNASYRDGLITLCAAAQAVFYKQPTRLFLHGFYIRGSLVEVWAFDRSGLCCSNVMDAKQGAGRFLFLFLQYERMTDQELGMSSIFHMDDKGQ